jgi:metallo-beta-lactamase family protein
MHLVRANGRQVLLDCGLFQGVKDLRERNWRPPPFSPPEIDAVVLSHAHLDHSGALPLLVRRGFRGPIFCTPATASLLELLLLDSAHIQEQDAARANRLGYSRHRPALPLYTVDDARSALRQVAAHGYGARFDVTAGFSATLRRAGHILGSATAELEIEGSRRLRVVYSGDLGRWGRPILRDPERVQRAEVLLVESTYGDRLHAADAAAELARVVNETAERRGALLIPAFAVGRTQELIWTLRQLEDAGRIPTLPVFVDSPMAIDATDIYCRHPEDHDLEMALLMDEKRCPLCCKQYHLVREAEASKRLNAFRGPLVIVSASGMATGGRILHHLAHRLPDTRTTVLLVGFQAAGTRGRALQAGAASVRIHGRDVPVRARVESLDGLSAHADRAELLRWLRGFESPPDQVYVVHGEAAAAAALTAAISEELRWRAGVARDGEVVSL